MKWKKKLDQSFANLSMLNNTLYKQLFCVSGYLVWIWE